VGVYRFNAAQLGRARLRDWRRRVIGLSAFLALVVLSAAGGLALLDDRQVEPYERLLSGVWNALNLILTLGDFQGLDSRQRLLLVVVMVIVVVLGAFAIGQLAGILSSDEVLTYRENHRMERQMKHLAGHAVVLGYVGLGRAIADRLLAAGRQVVVIDRDDDNAAAASERGLPAVTGDAGVDDGVLRAAHVDSAGVLFVTAGDPHRNLTLTLMSHALNPALQIVVVAESEQWGAMLRRAGATHVVVADHVLAEAMLGPAGAASTAR
jgi:hypothetical protein